MRACYYSLAGTKACDTCQNAPSANYPPISYPRLIVGTPSRSGKVIGHKMIIQEIINDVKMLDGKPANEITISYVKHLQARMENVSANHMSVRWWFVDDDILHCIVVYPNQEFRKYYEGDLND